MTKNNVIVGVFLEGTGELTQILYGPTMLTDQEAASIVSVFREELAGLESMYYISFADAKNY